MTTDHYFGQGDLEAIAEKVRSGQPLHFDPKNIADIAASIERSKSPNRGLKRFVAVFITCVYCLFGAAIAYGIYSVVRFLLK